LSSTFASSSLVRLLAPWAPPSPPATGLDTAQRLSQWVGAFDAIELQAAHRAIKALDAAPAAAGALPGLAQAFAQAREALAKAIAQDPALPNESTYAPYKRRHLELQRLMEQMVGALRAHVREQLAGAVPALRQLALLDAAMEKITARREQSLLPRAVALLERRFQQLHKDHLKSVPADAQDDPMAWHRPGQWLHTFANEWRQALLAELALRLEPVAGLVEAAGAELDSTQ
jgi:hypothetical protein